jgi:ribokinase
MGSRVIDLSRDNPGRSDVGRPAAAAPDTFVGVGGIGWGQFLRLEGSRTLGRNESRSATLVDARDYCKLHIVFHWLAVLTRDGSSPVPRIVPIGVVGRDAPGRRLVREMAAVGLETSYIDVSAAHPTTFSVSFQYPDGAGCNVTTSNGAAATLSPTRVEVVARRLLMAASRIVAVSLPEVSLGTRMAFLAALDGAGAFRVASFTSGELHKAGRQGVLDRVDLLALNEDEAAAVLGRAFDAECSEAFLADLARQLLAGNPRIRIILTAGSSGAFAFEDGAWDHCPAPEVPVVSTAGAGDALIAGVLAGRFAGLPLINPSRSGVPFCERGVSSALDVGVLAASFKLGAKDTIPANLSAAGLAELGQRLGLADIRWPLSVWRS